VRLDHADDVNHSDDSADRGDDHEYQQRSPYAAVCLIKWVSHGKVLADCMRTTKMPIGLMDYKKR